MTTKPKARKFRIKRSTPSAGNAAPEQRTPTPAPSTGATTRGVPPSPTRKDVPARKGRAADQLRQSVQDGRVEQPPAQPTPRPQPAAAQSDDIGDAAAQVAGEADINAIRQEGLTARQLRMARRLAKKHELAPTSDLDAVRLLREAGIDPFQRSSTLELAVPPAGGEHREGGPPDAFSQLPPQSTGQEGQEGRVQLPQTMDVQKNTVATTDLSPAERRVREISAIQRDISNRRRRKTGLLLVRLAFFVMIPTILAGFYFYKIATPMYATNSDFLIIQSEGSGGAGPLGGLLPTQFATNADSIAVQGYLQSKESMLRLDADVGFKSHFSQQWIDPIQRLSPDPSNEEAFKLYKKNVKISYDPTEGMIRMEVIAADPDISAEYSLRLIDYAQARVNGLSQQKRDDQMRDARQALDKATQARRDAQLALIELKVKDGVDPEAVIAAIRGQITNYETLVLEKELELSALLDNARPNKAKVDGIRGDLRRLAAILEKLNLRLNSPNAEGLSLAQRAIAQQLAQADLASADVALQLANTQMEQARTEANRQVRYLTIAVDPVAPEEASYPRSFENTILTFLIFSGIYLMISLTASILREQVTS